MLNDIVPPKCQVDIKWDEYLPVPRERAIMLEDFLAKHNTYEVIQGKFEVLRDKINYCIKKVDSTLTVNYKYKGSESIYGTFEF